MMMFIFDSETFMALIKSPENLIDKGTEIDSIPFSVVYEINKK